MIKVNIDKLINLNKFVTLETNNRIKLFYDQKISSAKKIDPLYVGLMTDIQKYILRGGKRLRPTLAVLGYKAAEGKDLDLALDAALSLELFHSFVLMHDDVMDGDTRRYGGPNITGIYQRRYARKLTPEHSLKQAESMAILAGELNEAFTFEVLAGLQLSATKRIELMDHFQYVLFETGAGQQLDVLNSSLSGINIKTIDKVNYYKTAQYSIISPLIFGLKLVDNDERLARQFMNYGKEVGLAFQLKDDMLGAFGTTRQTGKPVGSDIREGKQTLLAYYTKQLASDLQWKAVQTRLGKSDLTTEDIKLVKNIFKESGAQAKVDVAIQDHLQKALAIVETLKISTEVKELLASFAIYCVERKK